jgi:hypothetical protein
MSGGIDGRGFDGGGGSGTYPHKLLVCISGEDEGALSGEGSIADDSEEGFMYTGPGREIAELRRARVHEGSEGTAGCLCLLAIDPGRN